LVDTLQNKSILHEHRYHSTNTAPRPNTTNNMKRNSDTNQHSEAPLRNETPSETPNSDTKGTMLCLLKIRVCWNYPNKVCTNIQVFVRTYVHTQQIRSTCNVKQYSARAARAQHAPPGNTLTYAQQQLYTQLSMITYNIHRTYFTLSQHQQMQAFPSL